MHLTRHSPACNVASAILQLLYCNWPGSPSLIVRADHCCRCYFPAGASVSGAAVCTAAAEGPGGSQGGQAF